ncbi:MAG: thiamine diphosphokinase [Muribaculaceae bacterium]|nr:thiamine diphosphokinase [Muribaculaceae bacterium]
MTTIEDFSPEAVIIDAGIFPTSFQALRWLDSCRNIVCCDGAADEFLSMGYTPWRIVGDCDSMSEDIRLRFKDIIRKNPDQETNDQTKAVTYLRSKGIRRMVILGATGRREDHTLGNISLLIEYLKQDIEARIYTDYGVFIPVTGTKRFFCRTGTQISIFNFGSTEMTSEGLVYPIRNFHNWWEGTLNEACSDSFTIHADGPYLVFINY